MSVIVGTKIGSQDVSDLLYRRSLCLAFADKLYNLTKHRLSTCTGDAYRGGVPFIDCSCKYLIADKLLDQA